MALLLIHELGHILMGLYFGWHLKEIIILPFGGLTKFEDILNKPIKEELLVTIMGPLFQVIGYYLLKFKFDDSILTFYHYALLLFNLLPIIPLDGSKIFHLFLQTIFSFYKSYQILVIFSFLIALFLLLLNGILFKSSFIFLTLLLLYKEIYRLYKEYPYYYKKFLLERYLYKIRFRKRKTIKGASPTRMKRDYKHLFLIDKKYVTEREILAKTFDKQSSLW